MVQQLFILKLEPDLDPEPESFVNTWPEELSMHLIMISDTPHRGILTNVFALSSKVGIALGWGSLIVYTPELYPTVVRYVMRSNLHQTTSKVK